MIIMCFSTHGKILLRISMASIICLHLIRKMKIFLSILMPSIICIHSSQLVDHCYQKHTPHNAIEHTHPKILLSALAHQVS